MLIGCAVPVLRCCHHETARRSHSYDQNRAVLLLFALLIQDKLTRKALDQGKKTTWESENWLSGKNIPDGKLQVTNYIKNEMK